MSMVLLLLATQSEAPLMNSSQINVGFGGNGDSQHLQNVSKSISGNTLDKSVKNQQIQVTQFKKQTQWKSTPDHHVGLKGRAFIKMATDP